MPWEVKGEVCDCGHLKSAHLPGGGSCCAPKDDTSLCKCNKYHKSRGQAGVAAKQAKEREDKIKKRIHGMDFTDKGPTKKEGIV